MDELFYLDSTPLTTSAQAVVFLVRPRVELMPALAAQIRTLARRSSAGAGSEASAPPLQRVLFVPRRAILCEKVLEEEGVLGEVTLSECALQWLPLERDLLLLASDGASALRDSACHGDTSTGLHALARALHALQRDCTGTVPLLRGKGAAARQLADMLLRLRREQHAGGAPPPVPPPHRAALPPYAMVLLDRAVDWATPLCTQLTYEGLIDEVLGITNGTVTLPPEGAAAGRKARLDSRDALFAELRDLNFGAACDSLRQRTAALASDYRAIKGSQAAADAADGAVAREQEVSAIGGFVRKLRDNIGGTGVDLHATIARALLDKSKARPFMARLALERGLVEGGKDGVDAAVEAAETLCYRGDGVIDALRMLCLANVTSGGLGSKRCEGVKRDLVASYGVQHLQTLQHCAAAGLLPPTPSSAVASSQAAFSSGFPAARGPLQLVVDSVDAQGAPGDIAFTHSHSAYAPLSVRLAALAVRPQGWRAERAVEEAVRALPGPQFECAQGLDERGEPAELPVEAAQAEASWAAACAGCGAGSRVPVLVCFVGGCTRSEVAALRWLSLQPGSPHYVVLTTQLLTAHSVFTALLAEGEGEEAQPATL